MTRSTTPVGTLYRRAIRRVERRAANRRATLAAHLGWADGCLVRDDELLRDACRLANRLARML